MKCHVITWYYNTKDKKKISWIYPETEEAICMEHIYIYAIHVYLKLLRTNSSLSYTSLLTIADGFTLNCWQSFMKRILADKMLY